MIIFIFFILAISGNLEHTRNYINICLHIINEDLLSTAVAWIYFVRVIEYRGWQRQKGQIWDLALNSALLDNYNVIVTINWALLSVEHYFLCCLFIIILICHNLSVENRHLHHRFPGRETAAWRKEWICLNVPSQKNNQMHRQGDPTHSVNVFIQLCTCTLIGFIQSGFPLCLLVSKPCFLYQQNWGGGDVWG